MLPGRIIISCVRPWACGIAVGLGLAMPVARGAEEAAAPKVFTDFKEALAHAGPRKQKVFIALMQSGHVDSEALSTMLADTKLYLEAEKMVLYEYRIDEPARADSFRAHFKITDATLPLVVVTDGAGKALGHKAGLLKEYDYYSFIENTAGYSALNLPTKVRLKRGIAASMKDAASGRDKYHTPMRTWTLVTGEKFEGAVLESTGDQVVFELSDGELKQVGATTLSRPDFEYLRKALEANQQ